MESPTPFENVVADFVAKFPKLQCLVTLLPKSSNLIRFLKRVTSTNSGLHRICLTRRYIGRQDALKTASAAAEARDFQDGMVPRHRFVYDVITRPSKKDITVTRVKWLYTERCVNCGEGDSSGDPAYCIYCYSAAQRHSSGCNSIIFTEETAAAAAAEAATATTKKTSYAAAYFRCTNKFAMPNATEALYMYRYAFE